MRRLGRILDEHGVKHERHSTTHPCAPVPANYPLLQNS